MHSRSLACACTQYEAHSQQQRFNCSHISALFKVKELIATKIDNLNQKKIINSHVLFNQTKEYTYSKRI
ncbi:hypothetical protein DWX51_10790 [Bacteroides uniformis]|uniref:SWIM-type domain-containing protein n=1 Tax=Bacteroides uniformis TaxID=820 RepID=A0A396FA43_BACUN|nr:hypothetical protein EYA81_05300 [Bacteroides sp. A1C1]RGJ51718.1 hypothetical protein DXD58_07400 [Bacteroides sp. D20]RGN92810.1 hypothetical protein DXB37_13485 [Bacteroides uniformis]RJV32224.1 hypothetical protein DWY41_00960 [Bacteroides sp. AF25-17LB]RGQ54506.1 hypothetical protein DWY92_00375 [Bacteroides uniformis]